MRVAVQGARGSFSHKAALLFLEQMGAARDQLQLVSCLTFDRVFQDLLSGGADFAAIPLENSSVGSIVANYDLLWRSAVNVVSEIYVDVQHNLLGLGGCDVDQLKEIYSHTVALDQCRQFLASVPNARAVAFWDTGGSAFHVKEQNNKEMAAIAGELAATEAGLEILKRNVEDYSGNRTRFGIIVPSAPENNSDKSRVKAAKLFESNEHYKLSCVVELSHKPGALAKLLNALAECRANLTKIESRPIPESPWHYRFFLDMQLVRETDACIVESIDKFTSISKILGRYPIWSD